MAVPAHGRERDDRYTTAGKGDMLHMDTFELYGQYKGKDKSARTKKNKSRKKYILLKRSAIAAWCLVPDGDCIVAVSFLPERIFIKAGQIMSK